MEQPAPIRQRILDAAEEVLRRHGPAKTTVVDVARHLGMSHANVYRHFASKADLRDAVVERWLHTITEPLALVAAGPEPAAWRLERWVLALAEAKRRKIHDDIEMFRTYHALAEGARTVIDAHVGALLGQVGGIIHDGQVDGSFRVGDPAMAARAVLSATIAFHHPEHLLSSGGHSRADELRAILALVIGGLRTGAI